ncbi:type III-B CRISPR module RAMP protein Cmr4 [Haliovirga abyssi]|uniref:Type III-B CRISPR module RAMP protein Cmr4 n=1 Tax=Haliovirga abyssi TaxID=2996794 RepID=A0AAU9DZD9_9FUSO|nr:type III-B CRISPR module RAMP protein Cmr4 [Haliovirga abyssi]BDU50900.1 type III-B CRISPR module RAMP protein Cmr4 [Haliovirga abyssi]
MCIKIKKDIYLIECFTNLHVGSGDNDFGLIDTRVQRDVITGFPTINSSSLKGALKEHCGDDLIEGFGNETQKGKYKFFPAKLLAIPARALDRPYYLVTCQEILDDFKEMMELFYKETEDFKNEEFQEEKEVEGYKTKKYIKYKKLIKDIDKEKGEEEILILEYKDFKELVSELPVIARNHLENGESQNLWYEEIVPRKSLFYFGIDKGIEEKVEGKTLEEKFEEKILFDENGGELIHIGGNVTIGYGACKIKKLKTKEGDKSE